MTMVQRKPLVHFAGQVSCHFAPREDLSRRRLPYFFNVYFVQPNIDIVIDILMDCILQGRTETPTKPQVKLRAY